jgi:16S rRNA (cytosine967-C5)-methyltransferase
MGGRKSADSLGTMNSGIRGREQAHSVSLSERRYPLPKPSPKSTPKLAPKPAPKPITPARRTAFEVLTLVGQNKGNSDDLLHSSHIAGLSPEDRNLATTLVMGVLRWQIALDARIRTLLQRPEQRLAEPVAIALRLGAFQLLYLDRIPAHAALSESVELCRAANEPHAAGMVNAILRKIAAAQKPGARIHESVAAFSERLGHPRWLVERWAGTYGREAALKICEADQQEPAEGTMFRESGTDQPEDLPRMDDGSRLVAELAAAAAPNAQRVWDCCAAPGGKTLVLARRLAKADILATDVSTKRLARLEARLSRHPYASHVHCAVADASTATAVEEAELFDLILCDVPCSGTGTLARNPEIRLRLKPEELPRQAERQRAILTGALRRLAPGGRLIYSTCSLEPEECERVVEAVTASSSLRTIPIDSLMPGLADSILSPSTDLSSALREGSLRTLPGVHPCDGFFAVVLERSKPVEK